MSKVIIGIHGLGNKPPEKLFKKWWKYSIREGLKAIGHSNLFLKFEMVYWAHYFYREPYNLNITDKNNPGYLIEPYAPALENAAHAHTAQKLKQKVLDYLEKQVNELFLTDDMSINFSSVTDLILQYFFKELDAYYSKIYIDNDKVEIKLMKDVIRDRLLQQLKKHKGKQIMLIAHSMGSIIAYDVLTHLAKDIEIDTFVTIGSPLGIPVIRGKIFSEVNGNSDAKQSLKTPENIVRNWFNFSDLDDKVALNYDLADNYEPNSSNIKVIDHVVYNNYEFDGERNPHKIYGYLRTHELAKVIHDFQNRGKSKIYMWFSDNIHRILRILKM